MLASQLPADIRLMFCQHKLYGQISEQTFSPPVSLVLKVIIKL